MSETQTREPISAKETMRQRRLQKLTELMDKGINPYPYKYNKDIDAKDLQEKYKGQIEIESGFEFEYSDRDLAHLQELKSKTDKMVLGQHFVIDDNGNDVILDLAWPDGVQTGLSKPLALLLNESDDVYAAANRAGYTYLTSIQDFKEYVKANYM